MNRGRLIIGGVLIYWGLTWMAGNLGLNWWLEQIPWRQVWPVILIFAGLTLFSWKGAKGALIGTLVTILTIVMVLWILFGSQVLR